MKKSIVMAIVAPGSCIHVNRDEWALEVVREPRPSCLDKWRWRNTLRDMQPGTHATINGVSVYRKNLAHQASRYQVDGEWMDVTAAIAAIEAATQPTQPSELRQLQLPLGELA